VLPVNSRLIGHGVKRSANRHDHFSYREIQQNHPSIED
jgi:hypothetical protein